MNTRYFVLILLFTTIILPGFSKSRLGEYYYGFGFGMAEGGKDDNLEGNFIRLNASGPNDSASDFSVFVDYGSIDNNGSDHSSWNIGLDYLVHYEDFIGTNSRIHPFLGLGVSFLDEESPTIMEEDGFTWSFLFGSEVKFTRSLSASLHGRFFGLWSDFSTTDFSTNLGLTWWIDNEHGVLFDYSRSIDAELNYFTLKYLYSSK